MRAMHWARLLQLMAWLVAGTAWAQLPPPSEANVAAWLARREALFDSRKIDVPQLSKAITSAVVDGERLVELNQYQQALDRLKELERYMPLDEIPSFDIHMLAGWVYGELGHPEARQRHREIASTYREVLWHRIGSGATPLEPLRVVMTSEISDWLKSHLSLLVNIKTLTAGGRELLYLTHIGPATSGKPKPLFVEIDRRTVEVMDRAIDIYQPIAIEQMRPQSAEWLRLAQERRARFLKDRSFIHAELDHEVRERVDEATRLLMAGKPEQALAALRTLESKRPIEEIPTPRLLTLYSLLLGRTGDVARQMDMRGLIFGVQQAIAHSGDALSPATAVHVIFIGEEYEWLREKKLKFLQQALVEVDDQRYDVMTVRDAQGKEVERFFNVTALFKRHGDVRGSSGDAWRPPTAASSTATARAPAAGTAAGTGSWH